VIEGCKEKGVDLSGLDSLDTSLYNSLRELRHTVFHTARKDRYVEARMFNVMTQPGSARRLRDIHHRMYDDYFAPEIERRGLWTGDEGATLSDVGLARVFDLRDLEDGAFGTTCEPRCGPGAGA
jgi:hypothetical protein